jgi:pilus assembly protein FimV
MQANDMTASAGAGSSDSIAADNDAYLEIAAGDGTSTVSGQDPAGMSAQELRAELSLSKERIETERVEKEALQQRVATLEQSLEKMQGLLSVEDEELSRVQSLNLPAEEAATEVSADAEMVDEMTTDADAVEDVTGETSDEISDEISETATAEELAEGASEDVAADAVFTDEISEQADAEEISGTEPAVVDTASSQSQLDKRPPADPLTQLINDPILLAAAGGGLLLIAALIGIIIKRRKAGVASTGASGFDNLEVLADSVAEEKAAAEGETKVESLAGEQVSEGETSDLAATEDTVVNETGASATLEEDKPRDDVIAEADVYLAYGIYQQAEDLLRQAIADNPDRNDYLIKLAETHYASKNADAFIEVAAQIKQRVDNDDSAEWKKIVVMGQDLCAENAMFQGAMVDDFDMDALAPDAPSMDFDLGLTEVEDASTVSDLDLSLDDESLEHSDDSTQILETEEEETPVDMSAEPVDEIEFDLSDTGAVEETATIEDDFSLDIDASELDIDIPEEVEKVTDTEEQSLDSDDIIALDDVADDSSAELEMDFALDTDNDAGAEIDVSVAETEEEEVILDLSDEVEIDSLDMDVIEDTGTAANDALVEEEDFDLFSLGDADEINTKLDLARAYLDMGDREGTRGILEEVLVDGNDEQKQEANDLMAKLA